MNIREHIASLCPQPISLEVTTFTPYAPEEIAYALAGCTSFQSNLLRYKYALENQRLYDLSMSWWLHLADYWKPYPKEFIGQQFRRKLGNMGLLKQLRGTPGMAESLSSLAFKDSVDHNVCPACNGVSKLIVETETLYVNNEVKNKGAEIVCFNCGGLGRKAQSMTQRARIFKVPKETWRRKWEPVFANMSSLINEEEALAAKIVTQRLGRY